MAWNNFFGRDNTPAPVPAPVPVVKFNQQMLEWLDELAWTERSMSGVVSASVFSRLRLISDVLSEIAGFLENYPVRAEEEYIIESTIRKYIPEALTIFNQLPAHERQDGGESDKMLLSQCDNIERSVRQLNKDMHERVKSNLASQTIFVEERFANQV